jgi:hypothetical protein
VLSCSPPGYGDFIRKGVSCSASSLGERLLPVETVGDGMQQPSAGRQIVLIAWRFKFATYVYGAAGENYAMVGGSVLAGAAGWSWKTVAASLTLDPLPSACL